MVKRSTKGKQPDKVKPAAASVKAKLTEEIARVPKLIRRSQQLSVDFLEVELPQTLAIKSRPGQSDGSLLYAPQRITEDRYSHRGKAEDRRETEAI